MIDGRGIGNKCDRGEKGGRFNPARYTLCREAALTVFGHVRVRGYHDCIPNEAGVQRHRPIRCAVRRDANLCPRRVPESLGPVARLVTNRIENAADLITLLGEDKQRSIQFRRKHHGGRMGSVDSVSLSLSFSTQGAIWGRIVVMGWIWGVGRRCRIATRL